MSDPAKELQRMLEENWRDELELRRQAESDPVLAEIIADADALYLAKYGKPWINPLAGGES